MKSKFRLIAFSALLGTFTLLGQERSALSDMADEILQAISDLRELEPRRDVQKGVLSREQIGEVFRKRIAEDYSAEDLEKERSLLVKLGVLPREYDYVEGTMQILNEQVAGYYDPRDKTLFIADWLPPETQQMTMAHELAHALQDQHYELEEILSGKDQNGDALLARRAIVEGDAVGVMFDYLLLPLQRSFVSLPNLKDLYEQTLNQQLSGQSQSQQLQKAPAFIRDSLLFSYVYGARFMQVYRKSFSWAETGGLYSRLPRSTEQIIHPEKYFSEPDDPTRIDTAVDDALIDWETEYSDIFGEYQAQLALREYLTDEKAELATAGWDGDRIRLLRHEDGKLALQWDTIWDDDSEAREFRDHYAELIRLKYQIGAPETQPESRLSWETEFDRIEITLQGRSVRILEIEKVPVVRQ